MRIDSPRCSSAIVKAYHKIPLDADLRFGVESAGMVNPIQELRAVLAQHPTQKAAAKALRISPSLLTDILKRRRAIAGPLLRRLGLRKHITYTKVA